MSPLTNDQADKDGDDVSENDGQMLTNWECFTAAVQFLTRIPVSESRQMSAQQATLALGHGVVFFPLLGGFIGLLSALIFWGASWGWSPWIAAFLAIGAEAILTGAFHEDAFADTCDALGGGWTREQVLEIMKDSRLGTYGTLGLLIVLGLRVACFVELASQGWSWAIASIIAASALGRVAIVGMMATTSPVADRISQARDISAFQTSSTLFTAIILAVPFWGLWFFYDFVRALATLMATIFLIAWFRHRLLLRVGGTTGDLLGCSSSLAQLFVLIGSAWR